MRQAGEAERVMSSPRPSDHGLRQILSDMVEEVKHSINKEINGAKLLNSLLNAPRLKSLLQVYECLRQHQREPAAPFLPYTTQLIQQILADLRTVRNTSAEARELYSLLRGPHFQALTSAHDTVAQKDYAPVRPPIPDNLADDEEAMRIVCLVKNKQQLRSSGEGIRSRWDTLRKMTRRRLIHGGARAVEGPWHGVGALGDIVPGERPVMPSSRRVSYPPAELLSSAGPPPLGKPLALPHFKPMSNCRTYQTDELWKEGLNRSAPSVCSSVLIDNVIEELDSDEDRESANTLSPLPHHDPPLQPRTLTAPCMAAYHLSMADYHHSPGTPPRFRSYSVSPRVCTAPPSPMQHQRVDEMPLNPPVELAKQKSLDELRSTVQQAASSVERSTNDVRLLGQKMAAATERMSESVQENAQALTLLAQVVSRLQTLIVASRAGADTPEPHRGTSSSSLPVNISARVQEHTASSMKTQTSLSHQSRVCSLYTSSSSSSSFTGSMDSISTSQGKISQPRSPACNGSPKAGLKTRVPPMSPKKHVGASPTSQKKHVEPQPQQPHLYNSLSTPSPPAPPAPNHNKTGCCSSSSQGKKKKKKKKRK
uniref:uncharacterized protein LOC124010970 isoform X1 n=1 Tax=Oncorhynchus gorbuscha TaxID=8017 RepID=UPI001EAF5D3E|nr:uncharacterized protein LOC124010970 isoform X1 [Oncorhynchus gorbuscha]XP_046179774.1 uncharacterized protein LOC124010970 isoform X1 [Oncorhynchus gorbuscha]